MNLNGIANLGDGSDGFADGVGEDRAVLVGAGEPRHMAELGRLAATLGMEVAGTLEQGRRDNAGYLGSGKRLELRDLVEKVGATFVVADDELTASQARRLEGDAGATVVDRAELIIRIFEVHAGDAASRMEVELADLQYRLPRVKGRNPELSRLGGGGGGGGGARRGSGEQQLEYDRRVIRGRIDTINRKLRREQKSREVRGTRLKESATPTVALVGYTNAGKTAILNSLSGAGRSTRDRLFETLETTTRVVEGSGHDGEASHPDFAVTDTVGFIRKLPTQLVHSFASTLEAARDADIKVLCADASSGEVDEEISTASRALSEGPGRRNGRGAGPLAAPPDILCLNKMDLVPAERARKLRQDYPGAVFVSALHDDMGNLREEIYRKIDSGRERMDLLIPHSDYAAASRLYGLAEIHTQESDAEGVRLDVSLPRPAVAKYDRYRTTRRHFDV